MADSSEVPSLPWREWPWWLIAAVVFVEVLGFAVVQSRVAPEDDWVAAAEFVREHHEPKDAFVVAPDWADPLLRLHFGDMIPTAVAGRADLAPFERLWEVSIRGHRTEQDLAPAFETGFGRVRVRRFDLGPSPVLYDFVDHVREARVQRGDRPCAWRSGASNQGGLWRGPLWPRERHQCGPEPWIFVGETVTEDLHLQARRCIWQHPPPGDVVRSTFRNVPLGERLVFYAGLYYQHEREGIRGPVTARISVDGVEVGRLVHRDGDGWKRVELDPDPVNSGATHGDVSVEVDAPDPHYRTLCWAATTRGPAREAGE